MSRATTEVLAVDGGPPVRTTAVPPWPVFTPADIEAAARVLASGKVNYWTGGEGRAFEAEFAAWAGATHAVALANGTVALELALLALGVGPGAEVVVPAATFVATASAVARCGAVPVVADIALDSRCVTAETIEARLTARTRAVIVVHVGGHPADMPPIVALARRRGLALVEDCAQAHGAHLAGRPVGTFGDIAAWSFCQDKIMSTGGEGGAITTDSAELHRRCWEFKDHGKNLVAVREPATGTGFRWLHDSFGTNGRLTEVQAAIGRRQLAVVDEWVARRRANAAALHEGLRGLDAVRLPTPQDGHACYRFAFEVRSERLAAGWDRDRFVAAVAAEGVPASQGGCTEIHRERAFDAIRPRGVRLPNSEVLGRTGVTLLVHPTLGAADIADMIEAVRKVCAAATV